LRLSQSFLALVEGGVLQSHLGIVWWRGGGQGGGGGRRKQRALQCSAPPNTLTTH
jgi:hypothetical protein